jgi:hypothetical protein
MNGKTGLSFPEQQTLVLILCHLKWTLKKKGFISSMGTSGEKSCILCRYTELIFVPRIRWGSKGVQGDLKGIWEL